MLLAKAALGLNDLRTASRAIELAGRNGDGQSEFKLVRAAVRWKRGRFDAAAVDLRGLVAADPTDVEAHCLLAEVLSAQGRPRAARSQFQLARQLDPDSAWAQAGLASIRSGGKVGNRIALPPQ